MESLTINAVGVSPDYSQGIASGINKIIEGQYVQPVKKISLFIKGNPKSLLDLDTSHLEHFKRMANLWKNKINQGIMLKEQKESTKGMIKELDFKANLTKAFLNLKEQAKQYRIPRISSKTFLSVARGNYVKVNSVIDEAIRRSMVKHPFILKLKNLIALQAFNGDETKATQELVNHDSEYLLEAVNLAKHMPEFQNELARLKKEYELLKSELKDVDLSKVKAETVIGKLPVKLEMTSEAIEQEKQSSEINNAIPSVDVITKKNEVISKVKKFKKPAMIAGGLYLAMQMLG